MDIIEILAHDARVIVLTSEDERSIVTWNQADTLQWWRPVVRANVSDYDEGHFDPNDWEECGILTQSGYGPKTYADAREAALGWLHSLRLL